MGNDTTFSAAIIRVRREHLLAWFDRHERDLPWRRHVSLYGTWIAETMLQQTTVATVAGRWTAFMTRFPDVRSLAEAAESEILAAWSGLGYYRRARSLHQAARLVMLEHGGRLPCDLAGWRSLPGVGQYTAAAVASIGLGQAVPAIDVNVRRVLLRWYWADGRKAAVMTPSRVQELAEANLSGGRPGDWNQALMDLGAGLCLAAATDCPHCPVRPWCAAGLAGTGARVPLPGRRSSVERVQLGALALRHRDEILWLPSEAATVARTPGLGRPRRASLVGLLAGMWCLPMTPWYAEDGEPCHARFLGSWRRWLRDLGWQRPQIAAAGWHRHAITNHRLRVQTISAIWPEFLTRPEVSGAVWLPIEQRPAVPSLTRRSLDAVMASGWGSPAINDL